MHRLTVPFAIALMTVFGVIAMQSQSGFAQETVTDETATGLTQDVQAGPGATMQVNRIGLVDLDGVLRKSAGTQKVRELLDEQRLAFQKEFTIRETALQESERALQDDKSKISQEQFNIRLTGFEAEVAEVQRQIQYRRQALDQAFQEAQREIRSLAYEIVKEIAAERRLDLVLAQDAALIFLPTLNISDDVLARLNKRTENARIEIKVSANE
jgi:Skp family chaperone for outer membrane proteins